MFPNNLFRSSRTSILVAAIVRVSFCVPLLVGTAGIGSAQIESDKMSSEPVTTNESGLLCPQIDKQDGCPLRLSYQRRDDSDPQAPRLYYNLQNIALKPIQAFAIKRSGDGTTSVTTSAQGELPLEVGEIIEYSFAVAAKTDFPESLSIDYVRFLDGEAWGEDSSEQSDLIDGMLEGIFHAVSEVKLMASAPDLEQRFEMLERQRVAGTLKPVIAEDRSERWRSGFTSTYALAIGQIYSIFKENGPTGLKVVFDDYARTSSRR